LTEERIPMERIVIGAISSACDTRSKCVNQLKRDGEGQWKTVFSTGYDSRGFRVFPAANVELRKNCGPRVILEPQFFLVGRRTASRKMKRLLINNLKVGYLIRYLTNILAAYPKISYSAAFKVFSGIYADKRTFRYPISRSRLK
jgi:hypothetical protein